MKAYIERMKEERTAHERRRFAMRVAAICTALIFIAWITTLGLRLGHQGEQSPTVNTANTLSAVGAEQTFIPQ